MRLVVLGADGQVGWELQRALAPLGDVIALGRTQAPGADGAQAPRAAGAAASRGVERRGLCGDLERPDALGRTLRELAPDVIVNAAAFTDVDRAESEPELARRVNVEGAALVAREAAALGARLVHYSTDYVFDGSGARAWRETDAPAPLNVYGETKRQGDRAVHDAGGAHLIFRTQWVYSARRRNFLLTILHAAGERETLEVVDDQIGAPTSAELVADVTAHALVAARDGALPTGTYHLAARGETSWCGYARFVVATARRAGWPLRLAEDGVAAVPTAARPTPAARPLNARLDVTRLEHSLGLRMPDWRCGVARVLAELTERLDSTRR